MVRALSRVGEPLPEGTPRWPEKGVAEAAGRKTAAPAPFAPLRLAAEKTKLERLLARNSLDAKRQFLKFCKEIPPGVFASEIGALEVCMEKLDFRKARQLLAIFPADKLESSSERECL